MSLHPISNIPLCEPEIDGNEWNYVRDCLDTKWVSSVGRYVDRIEKRVAEIVGCDFSVATVNGTAALHTAMIVAGIKRDDEVFVPALTFIAPANAVRYVGAHPVFIDIDAHHLHLCPIKLTQFIEQNCAMQDGVLVNRYSGRKLSAIIVVHVLGHPADMDPIKNIAEEYNLIVIEDAAESLGSKYKGADTGSIGDIGCLSFNGNKIITGGGGGMIVTNKKQWYERARHLTTQAKSQPYEYVHDEMGYNYRLSNLQAAVILAQLEKLEAYVDKKRMIWNKYFAALNGVKGVAVFTEAPWARSNNWMTTVFIDRDKYGMDSRTLMSKLREHRIESRPLWQPINENVMYVDEQGKNCEQAHTAYENGLSLPSSVGLSPMDQNRVIGLLQQCALERCEH